MMVGLPWPWWFRWAARWWPQRSGYDRSPNPSRSRRSGEKAVEVIRIRITAVGRRAIAGE
jgi:hypothetical protein